MNVLLTNFLGQSPFTLNFNIEKINESTSITNPFSITNITPDINNSHSITFNDTEAVYHTFIINLIGIQDANGCETTFAEDETSSITIQKLPTVSIELPIDEDANICLGESLTLNASPNNATNYTYSWNDVNNSTGASIAVSPNETTDYTVTVTDSLGCSNSVTQTITVLQDISDFDISINDETVSIDNNGIFTHNLFVCDDINNFPIEIKINSPINSQTYTLNENNNSSNTWNSFANSLGEISSNLLVSGEDFCQRIIPIHILSLIHI